MTNNTALMYYPTLQARDAAWQQFFASRKGCKRLSIIPNDDGFEDGGYELTNLREGYYIEVPAALRRAWIDAQKERDARGLRGPEHAAARHALFCGALDAAEAA